MTTTSGPLKRFLTAAGAIAAGTSVYADIIYFENPPPGEKGHYDWHWEWEIDWESWLDITRAPDEQTNEFSGASISQISGRTSAFWNYTGREDSAEVSYLENFRLVKAFEFGELIIGPFHSYATHAYSKYSNKDYILSDFESGVRAYIGVRTTSGNYGWIAVERGDGAFWDQMSLTAFGWAYETEPGVPIRAGQIPTPGTLAALAFGAAGLGVNRRKRA